MSAGSNPYRERIRLFPDRIFLFEDEAGDVRKVQEIARSDAESGKEIVCEIGSGSGSHVLALASRKHPATYFGFELRYKRAVRTIEKAQRVGLENVYVLHRDAALLSELFSCKQLDAVYVNFPDPWEKRAQRKHRLLRPSYLELVCTRLRNGGLFSFKTDHADYFDEVLATLSDMPEFTIERKTRDVAKSEFSKENIPTEFELMFRREGKAIHYLLARKSESTTMSEGE